MQMLDKTLPPSDEGGVERKRNGGRDSNINILYLFLSLSHFLQNASSLVRGSLGVGLKNMKKQTTL